MIVVVNFWVIFSMYVYIETLILIVNMHVCVGINEIFCACVNLCACTCVTLILTLNLIHEMYLAIDEGISLPICCIVAHRWWKLLVL